MSDLFRKYVELTLLKVTPQEIPGHPLVVWISIAAAFLTSVAGLLFAYSFGDAIFRSLLAIVVPGLLVYAMLGVRSLQPRFRQAYSAICGSAAIIYLIAIPLLPAFFSATAESPAGKLVIIAILLLDLWSVIITAHIFKHTFDIGFPSGVSMAVVMMIVTLMTIEALAPTPRLVQQPTDTLEGVTGKSISVNTPMAMFVWRGLYRSG